ncbi:MAG: helix-turn-helix transcriptional regulator [Thermoanaerobaculia bacterium]
MTTHQFILIVDGPDLQHEAHLNALFEAGCDDATVGRLGAIQYLDFDREAESFADAVLGATEAIEKTGLGARVVHLEPDDLVTMSEIAERTGRTRESVRLLISGQRGPGRFPAPATHFKNRRRMWRWQEVAAWFARALGEPQAVGDPSNSRFITAFNAGLSWRQVEGQLPDAERQRIRQLVG